MGWSTVIEYYQVSGGSNESVSTESRTVTTSGRIYVPTSVVDGEIVWGHFADGEPVTVEQVRMVRTQTAILVYECRGVARETAEAARYSSSSGNPNTGSWSSTRVDARRGNEADGWTVTKTVTNVTVTRDAWTTKV